MTPGNKLEEWGLGRGRSQWTRCVIDQVVAFDVLGLSTYAKHFALSNPVSNTSAGEEPSIC